MTQAYVHGYDPRENRRLQDQASTLVELLHSDTVYPDGSSVLEAGCGVGAQTITLASNSPKARITSMDVSDASLGEARKAVQAAGINNVTLRQADIFDLPFPPESFDHVFVCFVLEHLVQPVEALRALKHILKPGGSITVIEGDHGSTYFHPNSDYARRAVHCLVEVQARAMGNALIGRALYPLLIQAGFSQVQVSPRMVYVDSSKPELVEGFTKKTFTAMIEGVRKSSLEAGLISAADFDQGVADLYRPQKRTAFFATRFSKQVPSKLRCRNARLPTLTLEAPMSTVPQAAPINGLHHFAYRCKDAEETRQFYEDVLGLPLYHIIQSDVVPSTGEYCPYTHIFFRMTDGSCIAFFDLGDDVAAEKSPNTPDWVNHIALRVDTVEELARLKARLEAHGVEVLGVTDHHIFKSIYFFDPNGIRVELTAQLASEMEMQEDSKTARARLDEWTQRKIQWRRERAASVHR